jgi:hypothetical protein
MRNDYTIKHHVYSDKPNDHNVMLHDYNEMQHHYNVKRHHSTVKGTVSRDFLPLVFFMNQFPPSP